MFKYSNTREAIFDEEQSEIFTGELGVTNTAAEGKK